MPIRRERNLVGALLLGTPAEGFTTRPLRALSRAAHDLSRALKATELTAEFCAPSVCPRSGSCRPASLTRSAIRSARS